MSKINDRQPEPDSVAKAIYRAATDRSSRLRYAPNGELVMFLHGLLPDRLWHLLVKSIVLRNSKSNVD